jgi:hypothetical protein
MQIGMSFAREGGKPHSPVDTALSRRYSYTVYDKSRANSERYPAYQKLDISLTLVWSIGEVNIRNYFSILNALNAGNVYFEYWKVSSQEVRAYHQWKRLVIAGVEVEF